MFRRLKLQWRDLKCGRPGTRFKQRWRAREQRRRSYCAKSLNMMLGLLVLLIGLVLLPAPGPGCIVVFIGATLIAEESFWAANLLDRLELKARRILAAAARSWKRASVSLKTVAILAASSAVAVGGWATFQFVV
jgi:uncharacterized protein (TIGR02611 family)